MTLVLQGIRILDITDGVSGPYSTMLLGSLGAEVLKIESIRHLGFREGGNTVKKIPGLPQGAEGPVTLHQIDIASLMTPGFARYGLDKLSVVLNLTKPEGRDLFKRLVGISDVVIDNLSFGIMRRWGFDYASLRQLKKDIIVASLPSFGNGPHENWTTWGMNLLGFTGFAYTWGHPDTPIEERASSSTYGDYIAGTIAAAGVLAALFHRANTGEGQYIEVSQTESTASLLGLEFLDYFINKRVPEPVGNRHPRFAPYNCYRCQGEDRWCVITVTSEDEWQQFCKALESPQWTADPKFANMETRFKNVDELDRNIEAWTRKRTPHQVIRILQSFGVPAGVVQNSEDLFFDLQLRIRGHMEELEAGPQKKLTFDGPPLHLSTGQKASTDRAPNLGEHNSYVYQQLLGLNPEEIERLIQNQVIY